MDLSDKTFRSSTTNLTFSSDTMSHTNMVLACRWAFGSSAGPNGESQASTPSQPAPIRAILAESKNDSRTKRFAPCQGRLYHQLLCGHRIRTDLVEDCGPNCLDPFTRTPQIPFACHGCVEFRLKEIWAEREIQHNSAYPPIELMSKAQYEQWYDEHRELEAQFAKDRVTYEMELKASMRSSNTCSAMEASQEEKDFAAEMAALSLVMTTTNDSVATDDSPIRESRTSLPSDEAMQLHWSLSALAIDRGACGIEHSSLGSLGVSGNTTTTMTDEELWGFPRAP